MSVSEMVDRIAAYSQSVLLLGVLLLVGGWRAECSAQPASPAPTDQAKYEPDMEIQNLRAFAKLYGYVRYFHPSDAAANTDWEKFAIHGVRHVQDASTRAELRTRLDSLFSPIAPTVALYDSDEQPPAPTDQLTPSDTTGLTLVAWQHQGIGFEKGNVPKRYRKMYDQLPYESRRLHREGENTNASHQSIAQAIYVLDASQYRGQEVKLRAAVKTKSQNDEAYLSIYSLGPGLQPSRDDLFAKSISSPEWTVGKHVHTISSNAKRLVVGIATKGRNTAWADSVRLFTRASAEDAWEPIEIKNPGFEQGKTADWKLMGRSGAEATIVKGTAKQGKQSVRLAGNTTTDRDGRLFDAHPSPGTVVNKPLGRGLSAQIPIALYSREGQTLRPEGAPPMSELHSVLKDVTVDTLTANAETLRHANVTIAWTIFQHFYPYFDVVSVDWDTVLTRTLHRARADTSSKAFLRTLQRMVAPLGDGHGRVRHPVADSTTGLPIRVDQVKIG